MALNKQALQQGIIRLQQDMQRKTDASMEEYAERLASLIDAFVKSGEVTVQAGAYTGATTSEGKGKIT